MYPKPTYEELLEKLKKLEEENRALMKDLPESVRDPDAAGMEPEKEEDLLGFIIDVKELQSIMDDFYNLTGMVTAILDMNGMIIEKTGWQDICMKFHRIHPETAKNCTESDLFLVNNIKPGEYIDYQCKNGLWDVVTPLYIGTKHMGNIYTGQFFYDDDKVDEKRFLRQAEEYGFDKDSYMAAFHRIPRYSRKEIRHLMDFLVKFTSYISHVSYAKLKLEKEVRERKDAEKALANQKKRLDYIIQGMNVGTWEWNVQTGETIFNDRWAEMAGYSLEELFPITIDTWVNLCHPEDMKESERLLQKCFNKTMEYYDSECRMKHKDGHWVWVLDRGKVLTWTEEGKPEWMFGTHLDITEPKQAAMEKEKLLIQLSHAQKMESVGRLAGGVAHDFNNMLGVILGHTELAIDQLNTGSGESLLENLEAIQNAADHSAALTRQLLAFARKETVTPKVLDLNHTVEGLISMLQRIISENIELAWIPDENLPPIKIDPNQIDQILANLCINARDSIDGIGKVTIETGTGSFDEIYCKDHLGFQPGDYVMLAVSDNGCGMDRDTLSNIFEPFFTTKKLGKGTGLGLSTVYGVVRQNKGFINVYSEPGHGTTFRIYLPRYILKVPEPKLTSSPAVNKTGSETILLVEDEPAILKMTALMLEKEGYTVVKAGTAVKALEYANELYDKIDLLITDVIMPDITGQDIARNILKLNQDIKCLFMSGYTANVIADQGVLDDGINFIQKPFSLKSLSDKVRNVLDEK